MYDTINDTYTTLEHHGVKGMKWGVRKIEDTTSRAVGRALSYTRRAYNNYRDNRNIRKAYTTGKRKYINRIYRKINRLDGEDREKYLRKLESQNRARSMLQNIKSKDSTSSQIMNAIQGIPSALARQTIENLVKNYGGRFSRDISKIIDGTVSPEYIKDIEKSISKNANPVKVMQKTKETRLMIPFEKHFKKNKKRR